MLRWGARHCCDWTIRLKNCGNVAVAWPLTARAQLVPMSVVGYMASESAETVGPVGYLRTLQKMVEEQVAQ